MNSTMTKFIQTVLLMAISSCCFAMAIVAMVGYNQLVYNTSDGIIISIIILMFLCGIISAAMFVKTFNEMFLK